MDPEQTFLRVHARLSGMLSQLLTPRIRLVLEYVYLAVAVALFCLLVVMHTNFVQQPGCSSELAGINFTEAQLFQIKITSGELWAQISAEQNIVNSQQQENLVESTKGPDVNGDGFTFFSTKFWSYWIVSGARSKLIFKSWRSDKEYLERQVEKGADITIAKYTSEEQAVKAETQELQKERSITTREAFKATLFHLCHIHASLLAKIAKQFSGSSNEKQLSSSDNQISKTAGRNVNIPKLSELFHVEHLNSFLVQWLERRSKGFEPTYLYTSEKGYFLLPEVAKARHNIRTVNVTISAENLCFGNRWQQLLINSLVGYDTILMNSLLSYPGQGYLYNYQTKEFYDLSYGHESSGPARFGDYFVTKCGVLIMSLFVFFTTTMSVSFTLRETQSRMLRFTVQLQHHARHQLPTFQLIFVHVIESLVFVPIMIGILFFLFEFYVDQLLAFLVLTLVWLCELFTMISVRTPISMQFFPRFFLLYFLVFHIYFFSYAYGIFLLTQCPFKYILSSWPLSISWTEMLIFYHFLAQNCSPGFSYLAFSATAAFMQHLILYFWNRFEVPALQRFLRTRAQFQQQSGVQITSSTIYTSTLHIARVNVRNPNTVNEHGVGPELPTRPNQPEPDGIADGARAQEQTARESSDTATRNPLHFHRDVRDQGQHYTQQPQPPPPDTHLS